MFTKHSAQHLKKCQKRSFVSVLNTFFTEVYCACHEKWAQGIRIPAPATRNHDHVPNQEWRLFHKQHPSSPNAAPAMKHDIQNHLSFWPTPASVFKATCRKCHACQADVKVPDVLHLSRKMTFQTSKCPESAAPAKWNRHSSKNEHGALVKLHLRNRAKPAKHFVRACAVEMRMDISTFVRKITVKKPGATECTLI